MKGHVLQEERAYINKHFVFETLQSVGTTCCICCVRWKGLEEVHNRAQQYLKFKRALETHSAQLQALLLISRIPEICSHTDRRKKLFCSVCNRTGTERLQTERQLLDQKRGGGGGTGFFVLTCVSNGFISNIIVYFSNFLHYKDNLVSLKRNQLVTLRFLTEKLTSGCYHSLMNVRLLHTVFLWST